MTAHHRQKIITFTGSLASGKSTVAKRLAQELAVPYFSGGSFQRDWAEKKRKGVDEVNADPKDNVWLDEKIDGHLQAMGREKDPAPQIVDSRLGWHFIPNSLKIYLYTAKEVAIDRRLANPQSGETYSSRAEAEEKLSSRRAEERERFMKKYGADFSDLGNYDVFIDTSYMAPDIVYRIVKSCAERHMRGEDVRNEHWISPLQAVPLEFIPPKIEDIKAIAEKMEDNPDTDFGDKPRVVFFKDHYYISDGHKRTTAAAIADIQAWPVEIFQDRDRLPGTNIEAQAERIDGFVPSHYYDWQDIVKHFRAEKGKAEVAWAQIGKNVPLRPFSDRSSPDNEALPSAGRPAP